MADIKDDIYEPSKTPPKSIVSISPDREEFSTDLDEIQENLFSESSKQLFKREKFQSVYDFQQKSSRFPKKSTSLHDKLFSFSERISSKSKGKLNKTYKYIFLEFGSKAFLIFDMFSHICLTFIYFDPIT